MRVPSVSGTLCVRGGMLLAAASIATAMMPHSAARANVITFQNNVPGSSYAGTQDTQLFGYSTAVDESSGTYPALAVGNLNVNQPRVAIIRFDGLNALMGQYSAITSATLTLAQYSTYGSAGDTSVSVYQISDANAGWTQGTTYLGPPAAGEHGATWNHKDYSNDVGYPITTWAGTAGLSTATTDYDATAQDSVAVSWASDADATPHSWNLSPTMINQWITGVNAGLLIKIDDPASQWAFYSSETGKAPILEIHYTPVPEPTTGALLLVGGALLLMRWRETGFTPAM